MSTSKYLLSTCSIFHAEMRQKGMKRHIHVPTWSQCSVHQTLLGIQIQFLRIGDNKNVGHVITRRLVNSEFRRR